MTGPIPKPYVLGTCGLGKMAECCRYLGCGKDGFECLKGGEFQALLDRRAAAKTMNARADNCEGWEKVKQ